MRRSPSEGIEDEPDSRLCVPFGRRFANAAAVSSLRPGGPPGASFRASGASSRIKADCTWLSSRSQASRALERSCALARTASGIVVAEPRAGEERLKAVVVRLGIGSNLWSWQRAQPIVRPRNTRPGRLGDVVQGVLPPQALVVQVDHVGVAAIEPGRDERPGIVGRDLVAGELQADELVVRHVAVEGLDDPVAISPGVGPGLVELEAVGVGVTAPGRASAAPSARRIAGSRAADRRLARRHPGGSSDGTRRCSSGVGGKPVRSKVSRRRSVARSASGAAAARCASRPARMNASIGFRTQDAFLTSGTAGRSGGRNAQCRGPRP